MHSKLITAFPYLYGLPSVAVITGSLRMRQLAVKKLIT